MATNLIVRDRVINKDILDIVYDIQSELRNGKLSQVKLSGRSISVTCPHHAGGKEKRNSCFINIGDESVEYGKTHCFTCGFSPSFAGFVGECFDKSEQWGEDWLIANYASDFIERSAVLEDIDIKEDYIIKRRPDESILDTFEDYHPYMDKRKITEDVRKKFKIKYDPKTKCIVFPVFGIDGKYKFSTRRSVEGKKFIIDKGADKKDIYLLDNAVRSNARTVFVVEAQISALVLEGWGYTAIALFGAGTSKEQMQELNRSGIRHFVLCYDPDQAGFKGRNRFLKYIDDGIFVDVLDLPLGKDPADMTKEEFDNLVSLQIGDYLVK